MILRGLMIEKNHRVAKQKLDKNCPIVPCCPLSPHGKPMGQKKRVVDDVRSPLLTQIFFTCKRDARNWKKRKPPLTTAASRGPRGTE